MDQNAESRGRAGFAGTIVVMVKPAVAGRVKTRLIGPLTGAQAAEVHAAMLECVLARAERWMCNRRCRLVLAMDAPAGAPQGRPARGDGSELRPIEPFPADSVAKANTRAWEVVAQGPGDLGDRLARVWRAIGGGPAAFLGVDSPDVPVGALAAVLPALERADAAVGRVADGGYWTLAARRPEPALLERIDWGTARVYDQTRAAAAGAGLRLVELPPWHDVDTPDDLTALRARLISADEPALVRLRARLAVACGAGAAAGPELRRP